MSDRPEMQNAFKNLRGTSTLLIAIFLLLPRLSLAVSSGTITSDLVGDWSNTANPNGPWTWLQGTSVLPHQVPDSATGLPTTDAFGPCPSSGCFLPAFWKGATFINIHSVDSFNGNPALGEAVLKWTSPVTGSISFNGKIWYGQPGLSRSNDFLLFLGTTLLQSGTVSFESAFDEAHAIALFGTATVNAGDEIKLVIQRSPGFTPGTIADITLTITTTPGGCSTATSAPISGSTGLQGVMDSASWPGGAVSSKINLDTGAITFLGGGGVPVGTPITLPGARTTPPAFPDGLNFTSVHLGAGTNLAFTTTQTGRQPPVILLSCQDVVLDAGSTLAASPLTGPGPVPDAFMGAAPTASFVSPAGFGPRSGIMPTAGTLFPAVGGSGGDGGAGAIEVFGPGGGSGGSAFVISAAQRISVNGTLSAMGLNATLTTAPGAQGGAGGSVRLASLLVEGAGSILTNGGADSDGVVRSPAGPVEIEAFVQDLFSGATVIAPIRGNAPVQAIPTNLPVISLDQVNTDLPAFERFGFPNTGSLTTPDVTLDPPPPTTPIDVKISLSTEHVPEGTPLAVRAVGTDGSSFSTTAIVSGPSAAAMLTLNAGTTYQITAVPATAFPSLRDASGLTVAAQPLMKPASVAFGATANQWMKAFGLATEQALNATQTPPARD